MINILEILKKIPNLEDMVFYSPLYGDVKVGIIETDKYPTDSYPIELYHPYECKTSETYLNCLTKEGYFGDFYYNEREPMLYPSRQNRDWSTFKVPRKDLPKGTSVMVSSDLNRWSLCSYYKEGYCSLIKGIKNCIPVEYIVPVDKFNFDNWSFKEEDNYGTTHKS